MAIEANPGPRIVANVATGERIASIVAGAALTLRAVFRPTLGRLALAACGALLLQRGLTGHSRLYDAMDRDAAVPERRRRRPAARDPVTRASMESFPASDPPSWTPVRGAGAKH